MAIFTKKESNKCQTERGKTGSLIHCRWEYNTFLGARDTDTIVSKNKAGKVPARNELFIQLLNN